MYINFAKFYLETFKKMKKIESGTFFLSTTVYVIGYSFSFSFIKFIMFHNVILFLMFTPLIITIKYKNFD